MKKLLFILPAFLAMGCSVQKDMDCCETDNSQCDEFYPYYNCPTGPKHGYYSREYKKWVYRTWTPPLNVHPYYPNTQTVYYVPVEIPVNNSTIISNTPRPSSLGEYRDNGKTDVYGNRLQPNQYPTRDASGQRGVGDVTRPNAPRVTKD